MPEEVICCVCKDVLLREPDEILDYFECQYDGCRSVTCENCVRHMWVYTECEEDGEVMITYKCPYCSKVLVLDHAWVFDGAFTDVPETFQEEVLPELPVLVDPIIGSRDNPIVLDFMDLDNDVIVIDDSDSETE